MPAGPSILGFVYFAAAKFVGYSAFCRCVIEPRLDLHQRESEAQATSILFVDPTQQADLVKPPSFLWAGAVRAGIGIAIGVTFGLSFWSLPYFSNHDLLADPLFFASLIPIRIFEWWILLRWIYRDYSFSSRTRATVIGTGILVSFACDVLGIVTAWVLPGGMWVC
jgi:hypothetical protein